MKTFARVRKDSMKNNKGTFSPRGTVMALASNTTQKPRNSPTAVLLSSDDDSDPVVRQSYRASRFEDSSRLPKQRSQMETQPRRHNQDADTRNEATDETDSDIIVPWRRRRLATKRTEHLPTDSESDSQAADLRDDLKALSGSRESFVSWLLRSS